jgi:small subunit ribosomal protein S1
VTKVVAFGAFVEIVPGVEGLVHISELADHHVETPGEVVQPGEEVRVKILEIDEERRRISLSIKRVGEGGPPLRDAFQAAATQAGQGAEAPEGADTELGLSEEVFADEAPKSGGLEITDEDLAAAHAAVEAEAEAAAAAEAEPAAEVEAEPAAEAEPASESVEEPAEDAPEAEADSDAEPGAEDS